MSFLAFMKILESKANRYDKGINLITLGRINKIYSQMEPYISQKSKVLDLGCGTGSLTLRAALKGAFVKGIDINAEMINICRQRIKMANIEDNVTLQEKGVAEITDEPGTSYDIVMSGLCFSELSDDEIHFALKEANRLLKPNGKLIIIDEVIPNNIFKRIFHLIIRIPVIIITYVLTQTSTKAVKKLPDKIKQANFEIEHICYALLGSLALVIATKSDIKKSETVN